MYNSINLSWLNCNQRDKCHQYNSSLIDVRNIKTSLIYNFAITAYIGITAACNYLGILVIYNILCNISFYYCSWCFCLTIFSIVVIDFDFIWFSFSVPFCGVFRPFLCTLPSMFYFLFSLQSLFFVLYQLQHYCFSCRRLLTSCIAFSYYLLFPFLLSFTKTFAWL